MQQYSRFILVHDAVDRGLVILANKYVLLSEGTPPTELTSCVPTLILVVTLSCPVWCQRPAVICK